MTELLASLLQTTTRLQRIRILLTVLQETTGATRAGLIVAQSPEAVYWQDRTEHPDPVYVNHHETHAFAPLLEWAERKPVGIVTASSISDVPLMKTISHVYVLRDTDLAGLVLLCGVQDDIERTEHLAFTIDLLTLVTVEQRTTNNLNKFLHDFAHDQRNSLNVVSMSADRLTETLELPPRGVVHLTRIFDNSLQIGNQIENALSVDRYNPETDEYHMTLQRIDLVELRREICDRYVPVAQGKKITLKLPYVRGTVNILGDLGMVTRAITNLVDNALKFTPDGGAVEVTITRGKTNIQITVSDTGPGIGPEYLDRIFERKVRVRQAKLIRGLGLGLYIVRNVALKHGGRAWVESTPGAGSTFYLSLPIKPQSNGTG